MERRQHQQHSAVGPLDGANAPSTSLHSRHSSSNQTYFASYNASSTNVSRSSGSRKRHLHHTSLPNPHSALDLVHPQPLSPFEERFLGRATHPVGIPLAEPITPPPTVTNKIISTVKRAVIMKKDKTPPDEETSQHVTYFATRVSTSSPTSSSPTTPSTPGQPKRPKMSPSQSIITAHRSPFGGYTKQGDFVVTRTADGRRLPVPQPHPHSLTNPRISLPPPPAHSALKKSSTMSLESGDSYTLVATPDSASTASSVNGGVGRLIRSNSMFAKLMGKSQKDSVVSSSTRSSLDIQISQRHTKKAVRFTTGSDEPS